MSANKGSGAKTTSSDRVLRSSVRSQMKKTTKNKSATKIISGKHVDSDALSAITFGYCLKGDQITKYFLNRKVETMIGYACNVVKNARLVHSSAVESGVLPEPDVELMAEVDASLATLTKYATLFDSNE